MSDFLATVLGLLFTIIVCLLAIQAILAPWIRVRRACSQNWLQTATTEEQSSSVVSQETQPAQSV